jgi:ATP-dependent RNA helicase DeaD
MKFTELNLPENILRSLREMGYQDLTPVQEATFSIVSAGKDLCALAETGSGKTSACAIPLVQRVDVNENTVQGLVIVPTRELCIQYVDEIQKVARHTHVKPFAAYGGFDREIQMAKLRHGVHILVATPGRLKDFIYEGAVDLANVRCVVLDEADELLREGFFDDIKFLMSCIVHEHQTLMFSATMTDQAKALAHDCLRNPEHISLISERATPKSLEHYFFHTSMKQKESDLVKYFEEDKPKQAIIFCNARHMVDKLCQIMRKHFKNVEYIHAGVEQGKRSSIFRAFKAGDIHYLIATDVAGRGLDFSHITHVINWDFPRGEQYNHRTGRAGRMGRKGKAFTFVTNHDIAAFNDLIRTQKIEAQWIGPVPSLEPHAHSGEPREHRRPFNPRRFNGPRH